jgi:hypothetical protein
MKEFNLEEALAGKPVLTRNGKNITELYFFKNSDVCEPLFGMVEGDKDVFSWNKDGIFNTYQKSGFDLFMAPEKKSIWVNVYENILSKELTVSAHYNSLRAIEDKHNLNGFTYLKTIEITNEI